MKAEIYLNRYPKKSGKHSVSIYIYCNNSRAYWNTGFEVKKLSDLKKNDKEDLEGKIIEAKKFHLDNPRSRAKEIINFLNGGKSESTLIEYFDKEIPRLNRGSQRLYITVRNALLDFHEDLPIDLVDYTFITDFNLFLKNKGVSINGRSAYMRTFRALYNKADKIEQFSSYPWRHFKIQNQVTIPRSMSLEEIQILSKRQDKECQLFMLSFYLCGLNMADLCLNDWKIRKGRFEVARKKVSSGTAFVSIKVEPEIETLIDLVPKFNNFQAYKSFLRRLNKRLQTIGQELNIEEKITSYSSRYTWANISQDLGAKQELIGEMMGHTRKGVTGRYLHQYSNKEKDKLNRKIIDLVKY